MDEFSLPNLPEMPIRTGKLYMLDKYLSDKFTELALAEDYTPISLPPVMPIDLLESKFREEDWQIKKPNDNQSRFVLTPEGTTMFAKLLEMPNFPTRVIYPDLMCVRENLFYQIGLEDVGNCSIEYVAKMISLADKYLKKIGFPDGSYNIVINDLNILRKWLDGLGISSGETKGKVLKEIDRTSSRLYKLKTNESFNEKYDDEIKNFQSSIKNLVDERLMQDILLLLDKEELVKNDYPSNISITEPYEVSSLKSKLNSNGVKFSLDPRLARGLEYYKSLQPRSSAIVFEVYADNSQICGGGVYDGLASKLNPALDIENRSELKYAQGFAFGRERVRNSLIKTCPEILGVIL